MKWVLNPDCLNFVFSKESLSKKSNTFSVTPTINPGQEKVFMIVKKLLRSIFDIQNVRCLQYFALQILNVPLKSATNCFAKNRNISKRPLFDHYCHSLTTIAKHSFLEGTLGTSLCLHPILGHYFDFLVS